jgi:hypothetical protein
MNLEKCMQELVTYQYLVGNVEELHEYLYIAA